MNLESLFQDEVKEYRQTLRDLPTSKHFPYIKSGKVVVPKIT